MAKFTASVSARSIQCSAESFADMIAALASACGLVGEMVSLKLKLRNEVSVEGEYLPEQLASVEELKEARTVNLRVGEWGDPLRVHLVMREGFAAFRSFDIEAPSRAELDRLVEVVRYEARRRTPWWWPVSSTPVRTAGIASSVGGVASAIFGYSSTAVVLIAVGLLMTWVTMLFPSFQIGAYRHQMKLRTVGKVGLWVVSTVAAAVLGSLVTTWMSAQ